MSSAISYAIDFIDSRRSGLRMPVSVAMFFARPKRFATTPPVVVVQDFAVKLFIPGQF